MRGKFFHAALTGRESSLVVMATVLIFIILVIRIVQNFFNKKTSTLFPTTLSGQAKWMVLLFGCSSLLAMLALVFETGEIAFDWVTAGLAVLSGISLVFAQLCSMLAMQSGTMVITMVFSTAGLIVPCVFGVLFFNEEMTFWQWSGILIFIAASSLLAASAKDIHQNFSFKTVLLLLGAFFANGGTAVCQKSLTYVNPEGSITLFSLLSFVVPTLVFVLLLFCPVDAEKREPLDRKVYLPTICLAIAMFILNQIVTVATNYVPTSVLFTIPSAGNNIIAAFMAALLFKEKITLKSIIGLTLSVLSLILVVG